MPLTDKKLVSNSKKVMSDAVPDRAFLQRFVRGYFCMFLSNGTNPTHRLRSSVTRIVTSKHSWEPYPFLTFRTHPELYCMRDELG